MSCGLLVDYSSSSDEEDAEAIKERKDNGQRRSDLSRAIDPGRTGASRSRHAQLISRDETTADREVGAV